MNPSPDKPSKRSVPMQVYAMGQAYLANQTWHRGFPPGEALRQAARLERKIWKESQPQEANQPSLFSGMWSWLMPILIMLGLAKQGAKEDDMEQVLNRARRPEFLPRFLDSARDGDKEKARYWLRRAMT